MKNTAKWFFVVVFSILFSAGFAGIRGPGKYCGVVIFDRWGGCTLYSGVYVMYISEDIKKQIRPYANQAVQINATEVFQEWNPGDGLIKAFDSIECLSGPGKQPYGVWLGGVQLKNLIACKEGEKPAVQMQIINTAQRPIEIQSGELAPTLLTTKGGDERIWLRCPANGPSVALVTRQGFWSGGSNPRWQSEKWTIGKENALPRTFKLKPGEKRRIKITFDLPPGQYEFLSGYGGGVHAGKCLAGNCVAFNVDENGLAKKPLQTHGLEFEPEPSQWFVNNDLPQDAIDHRDELLSKADQQIRDGLLQLAGKYPQMRRATNFERDVSLKSKKGRIRIMPSQKYFKQGATADGPVPESEQFDVMILVQEPPQYMTALGMGSVYPNLGLVGQIHARAGAPKLQAELKKLVDDALTPLKEFNDSLYIENHSEEVSVSEKRAIGWDLTTDDDFSCTLSAAQNQHTIGEPVLVKVRLTNHMDRDVTTRDCDQHYQFYSFDVIGPDSERLPLNKNTPRSFTGYNPKEHIIKPGQTYAAEINIADWYDISKPGLYTIQAKWCCFAKRAPYQRKSNTISVKVVPSE